MTPNFLILGICALIPFAIAMLWFNAKLFGGDNWQKIAGLSDEAHNTKASPGKLILSIFFNFLVAVGLYGAIVHAGAVISLCGGLPATLESETAMAFLADAGGNHMSFGHGAFHGVLMTIFFAIPFYGYVYIFERKSGKYFWVNVGYWAINMALMGGLIGQWGGNPIWL